MPTGRARRHSPLREQIIRPDSLPRPRSVPQRIGRDSPKSAALIH